MRESRRPREPRTMGELLRTLVAGRGWGEQVALGRLRDAWASVVGTTVAERSEPTRLQRGVLTVRAEAGAWTTELTLLARQIASATDAFLGGAIVREVRVVAGLPARR